jgi:heme/copper-type cytochrome/quinol oxidase subunit 4
MNGAPGHREWPVWLVWALLVAATLIGFYMAEVHFEPRIATTLAIVLAAVKIHIVFDQYMELGWRHSPLRQILAIWLAAVTVLLLGTYWNA